MWFVHSSAGSIQCMPSACPPVHSARLRRALQCTSAPSARLRRALQCTNAPGARLRRALQCTSARHNFLVLARIDTSTRALVGPVSIQIGQLCDIDIDDAMLFGVSLLHSMSSRALCIHHCVKRSKYGIYEIQAFSLLYSLLSTWLLISGYIVRVVFRVNISTLGRKRFEVITIQKCIVFTTL